MKEKQSSALSEALKWVVTVIFVLNIAVLPALPWLMSELYKIVYMDTGLYTSAAEFVSNPDSLYVRTVSFFEIYGICTAVILWQARRVLSNPSLGRPFVMSNARYLSIAAGACYVLSAAALVRTTIELAISPKLEVLITYNTLFVAVFFTAGLLCKVMSELFGQASELKDDNDLVI